MDRRAFIKNTLTTISSTMMLSEFAKATNDFKEQDSKMPVLFIGHGNPMNAIEENDFTKGWKNAASKLPPPKAILCISAHWLTNGTFVTAMEHPRTIHDFSGFPEKLFQQEYPAPGSPNFANETKQIIKKTNVGLDQEWGLDHGTWSILLPMYPLAKFPVYQLSIDYSKPPQYHYELAKELSSLRKKGVLIVGSGNIVHNLGMVQWSDKAFDWAIEFDEKIKQLILNNDHHSIINYEKFGAAAKLSIPTNDHYLPLIYSLALQDDKDEISFFNETTTMGSISMRSVKLG